MWIFWPLENGSKCTVSKILEKLRQRVGSGLSHYDLNLNFFFSINQLAPQNLTTSTKCNQTWKECFVLLNRVLNHEKKKFITAKLLGVDWVFQNAKWVTKCHKMTFSENTRLLPWILLTFSQFIEKVLKITGKVDTYKDKSLAHYQLRQVLTPVFWQVKSIPFVITVPALIFRVNNCGMLLGCAPRITCAFATRFAKLFHKNFPSTPYSLWSPDASNLVIAPYKLGLVR